MRFGIVVVRLSREGGGGGEGGCGGGRKCLGFRIQFGTSGGH